MASRPCSIPLANNPSNSLNASLPFVTCRWLHINNESEQENSAVAKTLVDFRFTIDTQFSCVHFCNGKRVVIHRIEIPSTL